MTNKEKLIQGLLAGAESNYTAVQAAVMVAIGESGLIDDYRLVEALQRGADAHNQVVVSGAYTGMGLMLKNSNRQ